MGAYGEAFDDFEDAGIRVVGLTAEGADEARAMIDDEDLPFDILHSVDVDAVEGELGMWVKRNERTFVQPAQFVIRPNGTVAQACYQSGPRGRLGPYEALDLVDSLRD